MFYDDGFNYLAGSETVSFNNVYKTFGKGGLFAAFFMVLGMFLIGIWSPVVSVLLGSTALIFLVIMNIISLSWAAIVVLLIMVGIIIYRLSRA